MELGDQVTYKAHDKQYGLDISGSLYAIDKGYRAYIISDYEVQGIKRGDIVKVLLKEGILYAF